MGSCKNCKWWSGPTGIGKNSGWGWCDNDESGSCLFEAIGHYDAYLLTAPTFGCVHFEPKPETTDWDHTKGEP